MNPLPSPITVNTGEQETISKTIDNFFVETKEFFERTHGFHESWFEIRSGEIAYNHRTISNDRIIYLSYKDQILAIVLETRTEFNHVSYTFYRNFS